MLLIAALSIAGCSSGGAQPHGPSGDAGVPDLASASFDAGSQSGGDGGLSDAAMMPVDGTSFSDLRPSGDLSTPPDMARFMGTIDITIFASNTCKISTNPSSIAMTAGSTFKVNWKNSPSSWYEVDIAKIDAFNQVPLVLGLEIGNSVLDSVHDWCGVFTGTFWFRISTACDSYDIPVNCSA
jgi:hypothetical protein